MNWTSDNDAPTTKRLKVRSCVKVQERKRKRRTMKWWFRAASGMAFQNEVTNNECHTVSHLTFVTCAAFCDVSHSNAVRRYRPIAIPAHSADFRLPLSAQFCLLCSLSRTTVFRRLYVSLSLSLSPRPLFWSHFNFIFWFLRIEDATHKHTLAHI